MKRNKIASWTAAVGMLLSLYSCSSGFEPADVNEDVNKTGTVHFKMSGAVNVAKTRATTTEIQSAEEKEVTTLLAVVFKDADNGVTTGDTDAESNTDDTFVKAVSVLATGETLDESKVYEIETGEPGEFHICFVANPSETTKGNITGLTPETSTVGDFKALIEEQAPEHKPMLMTSAFYGVKTRNTGIQDLGTVHLVRAMARIDIVNLADGLTITQAVLKQRTVKTALISDTPVLTDSYLGTDETYTMSLVGNSEPTDTDEAHICKETIYSYEQYGESVQDKAATMEITYTMGDKQYTHTVIFKDAESEDLPLKRNNLYRVKVKNAGSTILFIITVADWNEGAEFEVSGDDLAIPDEDPQP